MSLLHGPRDALRKVRGAARPFFRTASANRAGNLKLAPAVFLDLMRDAPRGSRRKLLRGLMRSLFHPPVPSTPEICEISSLANFESGYTRLALLLGQSGKIPPPGETEFLRSMLDQPSRYPGVIGVGDYLFLTAFVSILAPRRVIEIGTLTGFSAAVLAAALRRQHGDDNTVAVETIDVRLKCLVDETRPTGFEIARSFPELASMIRLHVPHDSTVIKELAETNELKIAFIDADHRHPQPLLDLLRLALFVEPGGWIVLHDVELGTRGRRASESGHPFAWGSAYGAEWLFDYWPFRKISGGNIGAVQLPERKQELISFALRLLSIPFEIADKHARRGRRPLYESLADLAS